MATWVKRVIVEKHFLMQITVQQIITCLSVFCQSIFKFWIQFCLNQRCVQLSCSLNRSPFVDKLMLSFNQLHRSLLFQDSCEMQVIIRSVKNGIIFIEEPLTLTFFIDAQKQNHLVAFQSCSFFSTQPQIWCFFQARTLLAFSRHMIKHSKLPPYYYMIMRNLPLLK